MWFHILIIVLLILILFCVSGENKPNTSKLESKLDELIYIIKSKY